MPGLNTDLVRNATPNFATTLANSMLISDTTMTLSSVTGLPTATGITLVIDATDPVSGASTPALKEVVTGVVSGSTVASLVRGLDGTSAIAHASGANVVMWITANLWNDFQTSYLTQHTQLGAHTALTNTGGATNTGGLTTDTATVTGNETVGGTLGVTGATTLTGAVSGAGYSTATISNPYKFSVYRNAAWTTGSPTVVNYDTKTFDTGSNVDVATNKGRFTAPLAGFYQFNGAASMTLSDTSIVQVLLYKNGSLANAGLAIGNGGGPTSVTGQVSALIQLAATDYVEVYAYGAGATGLTGSTLTYFQGFLVSAT